MIGARGRSESGVLLAIAFVAMVVAGFLVHAESAELGDPPAAGATPLTPLDAGSRMAAAPAITDRATMHRMVAAAAAVDGSDVRWLQRALAESPDPFVVAQAIAALSRLQRFGSAPAHLRLLADPRLRVRQEAVRAFGATAEPRYASALVDLLANGPELEHLVVQSLGRVGGEVARRALRARREESHDPVTLAFVREALRECDARADGGGAADVSARTTATSALSAAAAASTRRP